MGKILLTEFQEGFEELYNMVENLFVFIHCRSRRVQV